MTAFGYVVARLLKSFGIARVENYRAAAAFESHLIRESEEVIGALVWKNCEEVEEISGEYWKLRKIEKKQRSLSERIQELFSIVDSTQEARNSALAERATSSQQAFQDRERAIADIEGLRNENEEILREGRRLKRKHEGLKAKLEVLLEELPESATEIKASREELRQIKLAHQTLKERSDEIRKIVLNKEETLKELNKNIAAANNEVREQAEGEFGEIGRANKELTELRAKLGGLESEFTSLLSQVGNYILNNSNEPRLVPVIKKNRRLIRLIQYIQQSRARHFSLIS